MAGQATSIDILSERYASDLVLGERFGEFDAIEIHGVRNIGSCDKKAIVEVDDEHPEFFSVYCHLKVGGVECVADFDRVSVALHYANGLGHAYGFPVYNHVH